MNSNIFDLSALPLANSGPESQSTKRSDESSSGQFESVLGGAMSDSAVSDSAVPDRAPVKSASPAKPESPAKQDKRQDIQDTKEQSVGGNLKKSTPTASSDKPGSGRQIMESGIKAKPVARTQKQVLSKAGENKANELVTKLSQSKVTDLTSPKPKIKIDSTNSEPVKPSTIVDGTPKATKSLDKFAIDRVTVKGNEVEVMATSTEDKSKTVKITIPTDQFEKLMSPKLNLKPTLTEPVAQMAGKQVERVPLDGLVEPSAKLDELMDKLNLKEIQVKTAITQAVKAGTERPIARETVVKLVGAESSAEMLVRGRVQSVKEKTRIISRKRLAPKGIDLTSPQNSKAGSANQNLARGGTGRISLVNTRTSDGGLLLQAVKVRSEVFSPAEQFAGDAKISEAGSDKNFSSVMSTESSQTGSISGSKNSLTQVRFSLPEDIGQSLKSNGKSVTIKIDPEILGPVRLSLRLHGNQLQARLVVDSAQVKSMVEGSLDQLTDQLERAGIKVDSMDVNVAGSDVGSELFERSSAWIRPKLTTRVLEAEEADLMSLETAAPGRSSGEYVGSSGVNLFA